MEWFSDFIKEISKYLNNHDDTSIDRFNRLYTVAFLSTFVTVISTQQYDVGGRIVCWTPNDFTGAHNIYTYDTCWLGQMNYYISENFSRLDNPSTPREYPFLIYPWLPIILIAMTASFIAPYLIIWHGLSARSGINVKRLIATTDLDDLSSSINYIFLKRYLMQKSGSNYVICIYFLTKICYIFNVCSQILIINKLLIGNFWNINLVQYLRILSVKYNMWSSAHFPIEILCDFMVRMLGQNNNWFTIQCILPYNLFTKRLFALLMIWFIILLILNIIDLCFIWLYQRIWLSSRRYKYIINLFNLYKMYLYKNDDNQIMILAMDEQKYCQEFVYQYLGIDGYFLLKLLHARLSDINLSYLIVNLFERFIEEKHVQLQMKRLIKDNGHTVL